MDIQVLNNVNPLEFNKLYNMLNSITIPLTGEKAGEHGNRRGFPRHRRLVLGITRSRFGGLIGLSHDSTKYPEIFEEIVRIGDRICPFKFTSIHLNKNVTCPRHKDTNNKSKSMLVSFGEYTGGNIVIEGQIYDAKSNPIIFDGSKLEHWNTDDLQGTKYSLVYYCI